MKKDEKEWPIENQSETLPIDEKLEVKKQIIFNTSEISLTYLPDIRRFSSWNKLIR